MIMYEHFFPPRCARHFYNMWPVESGKFREKLHGKVRESQAISFELATGNPDNVIADDC